MPARTSTRSTRTSTASTRKGRASSTRQSANAVEIPDEGPVTELREQIAQVFGEAHKTLATQRKLAINLRKIQEACCYEPPATGKKGKFALQQDFEEDDFRAEIERCVVRMFSIKKVEPAGDRLLRFLTVFLKLGYEKDKDIHCQLDPEADPDVGPDTPSSRLAASIVGLALQFMKAKDKTVRFRATQFVSTIFNSVEYIDDEIFQQIRMGALSRRHDKEPWVRTQAALALGRFINQDDEEDSDDSDDDDDVVSGAALNKLHDLMAHDASAEVRRTVLRNLPITPNSLRNILERGRDIDATTRRVVYGKVLPTLGDFRFLSLVQREKIMRWGLTDRDDAVRKAAARLFREKWLEDCAASKDKRPEEEKKEGELAPPNMAALEELLERMDPVQSASKEDGMAHFAMRDFWEGRPDYCEALTMDHEFWTEKLNPAFAFIARTYNDHCLRKDEVTAQEMIDDKMPETWPFAFIVKEHLNRLVELQEHREELEGDEGEAAEVQEDLDDQDFVAQQLLHIARTLDYHDHEGRRAMYDTMRVAIAQVHLSERCTELAVEVLRTICGSRGESDFCALIQEAIAEVRDTLTDGDDEPTAESSDVEESFHSAMSDVEEPALMGLKKKGQELSPEEKEIQEEREFRVYMKCLYIAKFALQNVNCNLESETALMNILNTLIVPAVQSRRVPIRESGLVCLGLAAHLSKDLAENNMEVFLHCFKQGHDTMKEIAIQTLTDLIITHPQLLAPPAVDPDATEDAAPKANPLTGRITKMLLKGLHRLDNQSLSYIACTAACKLLFFAVGLLPPAHTAEILKAFTMAYFDPETISHPALTQELSYFLPVFCHSKLKNAQLMAHIMVPIMTKLVIMREETLEEYSEDLVSWTVITNHIADWTDGRKVFGATELGLDGKMSTHAEAEEPHIRLAIEILERVLSASAKDERKPLLTLLSKLHIAPSSSAKAGENAYEEELTTLHELVSEALESQAYTDAAQRNNLAKVEATLTKRLGEVGRAQDADEMTVVPAAEDTVAGATASPEPQAEAEAEAEANEEASSVLDEDEDEDETMLAGMQGEGTRMPLEDDDEDEDSSSTEMPVRKKPRTSAVTVTESDIMDELLDSELET
ncbi:nuclear condensing complex subunit [Phaeosphaeria sp. MPI-PUGE-AT-0046c]|nr:nuclear condensing complex subunit [Phaeosphaeria sp. MPI-PUGE-AT-0046c]